MKNSNKAPFIKIDILFAHSYMVLATPNLIIYDKIKNLDADERKAHVLQGTNHLLDRYHQDEFVIP